MVRPSLTLTENEGGTRCAACGRVYASLIPAFHAMYVGDGYHFLWGIPPFGSFARKLGIHGNSRQKRIG